MKNITFHDSFSPTGATDSVTYESGLFPIFDKTVLTADEKPCDVSVHLWCRRPMG